MMDIDKLKHRTAFMSLVTSFSSMMDIDKLKHE